MIGRTNAGAGGGSLNFTVIAVASEDALPETAKENTIAVITDTAITSWVFSATAPETPEAGMVWILTSTASTVGFNAVKKNGLWVYPSSVQQYIDDAWVSKTAKTWQDGAWVDWALYLIHAGAYAEGTEFKGQSSNCATVEVDGALILKTTTNTHATWYSSVALDLTNWDTLTFNVANGRLRYPLFAGCNLSKTARTDNFKSPFAAASVEFGSYDVNGTAMGAATGAVDISALTGEYYIGLAMTGSQNFNDATYANGGISIVDVYLS